MMLLMFYDFRLKYWFFLQLFSELRITFRYCELFRQTDHVQSSLHVAICLFFC